MDQSTENNEKNLKPEKPGFMVRLINWIKQLHDSKFYGEIVFKFNAGNVVHIEKKESMKDVP